MLEEKQIIDEVAKILQHDENTIKRYAEDLEWLRERERQSEYDMLRLGTIGVTSSGKSTLLNVILGENLLPVKVKPSSSQLVYCHWSEERKAVITFNDHSTKIYEGKELNQQLISSFADEEDSMHNQQGVKQVEIMTPNFALPHNILLIDSPGLDAYGLEGHEDLTMKTLLPTIDFCVFVTTCKPSSDGKTRSVLNQIAQASKPVIIVQNMLDSVTNDPDRGMSAAQVAEEHLRRVERIIRESVIKDKSRVSILQTSAIKALKAIINGSKSKRDQEDYIFSNFERLKKEITNKCNSLKPEISGLRQIALKQRIDSIIRDAEKDAGGVMLVESYKYAKLQESINSKIKKIYNVISDILKEENDLLSDRELDYSSREVTDDIKELIGKVYDNVGNMEGELNKFLVQNYKLLGGTERELFSNLSTVRKPGGSFSVITKMEDNWENVGDSIVSKTKRFFGSIGRALGVNVHPGQVNRPKQIINVESTRNEGHKYIINAFEALKAQISVWQGQITVALSKIFKEEASARKAYELRLNEGLEKESYRVIADKLKVISMKIKPTQWKPTETVSQRIDMREKMTISYRCERTVYQLYGIAQRKRHIMQNIAMNSSYLSSNMNFIIGDDPKTISDFIYEMFDQRIASTKISEGMNAITDSKKGYHLSIGYHIGRLNKPSSKNPVNYFFMVNAIQYGQACHRIINNIGIKEVIRPQDRLYFIVEDFREIISAEEATSHDFVNDTLKNMVDLRRLTAPHCQAFIMLLHDNPLYNMIAMEVQLNRHEIKDGVMLHNIMQKKYRYLLTPAVEANCEKIIRTWTRI